MKQIAILGAVMIGVVGLVINYFFLDPSNIHEERVNLWVNIGVMYLVILIPPFIFLDDDRRENASFIAEIFGVVVMKICQYLSIGFLIYIGLYTALVLLGVK